MCHRAAEYFLWPHPQVRPEETQLSRRGHAKTLLSGEGHLLPPSAPGRDPSRQLFVALGTAHGDHDVLSLWRAQALATASSGGDRRGRRAAEARREGFAAGGDGGGYDDDDDGDEGGGGYGGYGDDGFDGDGGDSEDLGATAAAQDALFQATADAAVASGMLGFGGLLLVPPNNGGLPGLLSAPRKVQRVEVDYDRVAKVVSARRGMRVHRRGGAHYVLFLLCMFHKPALQYVVLMPRPRSPSPLSCAG